MFMRRLPVYLLLDCSESMAGPAIEAVERGVKTLVSELRSNPLALESAYLAVLTFDRHARQVTPLTEVDSVPTAGKLSVRTGTSLGAALRLLLECIRRDVVKTTPTTKGDYKPLVFLLTDGQPTDNYGPAAAAVSRRQQSKDREYLRHRLRSRCRYRRAPRNHRHRPADAPDVAGIVPQVLCLAVRLRADGQHSTRRRQPTRRDAGLASRHGAGPQTPKRPRRAPSYVLSSRHVHEDEVAVIVALCPPGQRRSLRRPLPPIRSSLWRRAKAISSSRRSARRSWTAARPARIATTPMPGLVRVAPCSAPTPITVAL